MIEVKDLRLSSHEDEICSDAKVACAITWRNLTKIEPSIMVHILDDLTSGNFNLCGSYSLNDKVIRIGINNIKRSFACMPLDVALIIVVGHEITHKYQSEVLGKKLTPVEEHVNYKKCKFEIAAHKVGMKTLKAIYPNSSGYFILDGLKITIPRWTKFKYYLE
ncbi:MAG TPA: hypothetical protein PLP33_24935 [Leptospiraceae bacterium]|nr:hypothetical protein [Leptospiraceae bacterium]